MRADRGGAHDAAVEHARQPDVLDVRVNPRHLSGHLYARRRSAHHGVVGGTLRPRGTDRALKAPAPDQVSVRHAPGGVAVYTDRAVFTVSWSAGTPSAEAANSRSAKRASAAA